MFYHNINPIIVRIGPFQIRYYGVIFVLGFVIAYFLIYHLARKKGLRITKDDVIDSLFYILIGVIIGARLFHVVIYDFSYYVKNPLNIFAIWRGGLSFHGGLVGAVVAGVIFCKRKKMPFYKLADIFVIPLALGLSLGRIGNFINGELVGRVTNLPWCVKFKNYSGCRHPSQLYESFKNLVIFIVLWSIKDKKLKDGTLFWSFILMYSSFRFFIEFFRAPDEQIGFILGLTMGQWLCLIMFFIGICFIININKINKKKNPKN